MKRRNLLAVVLLGSLLLPLQTLSQSPSTQQPSKPPSQQPAPDDQDVIKINTNLVQVDAVVTRNGKQVTDLKAEDFVILQDGKPQAITNFSYVSNVPARPEVVAAAPAKRTEGPVPPVKIQAHDAHRTIAFVIDDYGLSFESIDQARRQLRKFVNEQMSPNDLVAVLRTSGEIGALQQFTTDRRLLLTAINHIKWNPCNRVGVHMFNHVQGPATSREDSCGDPYSLTLRALRYIVGGLGSLPGRKSMVILSDSMPVIKTDPGVSPYSPTAPAPGGGAAAMPAPGPANAPDGGSLDVTTDYQRMLQRIVESAIRGSVVIYAIDTRGVPDTFPGAGDPFPLSGASGRGGRGLQRVLSTRSGMVFAGREGSAILTSQTGGLMITNTNDFRIKDISDDQQGYYLIGFRPVGETFDRKFHQLTVRVKSKGLAVRTRTGFYGVTDNEVQAARAASRTASAALGSPFGLNEITVRLTSVFANPSDAGSLLRSSIYVNARDLSFTDGPEASHNAAFDVDSVLFGDNGVVMYERSQTATLRLNEQQYAQTLREGVVYGFDVPVKTSGALQFRIAVRDKTSGHLGTAGQVVDIPDLRKDQLSLSGIVLTRGMDSADVRGTKSPPQSSAGVVGEDPGSVPPMRSFRQGANLMFAYAVYKARVDSITHLLQLTSQTKIYRDGKVIYTGGAVPISIANQPDLQRITNGSRIQLGSDFPEGEYVLQIIVTDNLVKEKPRVAVQWIDFEIVK
jgi:VWFA-related protein